MSLLHRVVPDQTFSEAKRRFAPVVACLLIPCCALLPARVTAGPSSIPIPILYAQTTYMPGANGRIIDKTQAVFPSSPPRRSPLPLDIGIAFWSGDHRRLLAFRGTKQPATVRAYDAARGRFGPPADAVTALTDPGVHYTLPLGDITATYALDWSRDGRTLCYHIPKVGIALFDLRRGTRRLLQNPFLARHELTALTLSPDGRRIAFSVEGADEFHEELFQDLWLIGADGRGLHKLGHGASPAWAPQGQSLIATEGTDQDGRAILRYDARTGARSALTAIPQGAGPDARFGQARYSPDGRQIAVFGPPDPRAPEETALFLMSAGGTYLRTLATRQQLAEAGQPRLNW